MSLNLSVILLVSLEFSSVIMFSNLECVLGSFRKNHFLKPGPLPSPCTKGTLKFPEVIGLVVFSGSLIIGIGLNYILDRRMI